MDEPESDRSSLITPQEIADSGFDYLALGHVHVHRQVRHGNTLTCCPACPAPPPERLGSGHMTLVELTPGTGARAVAHELDPKAAPRRRTRAAATKG